MKAEDLSGKVAVISGGGGAIGSALALRLASEGCRIAAIDRNAESLAELLRVIPDTQLVAIASDLSDEAEASAAMLRVAEHFGSLDLLVNAVGTLGPTGPIAELSVDEFDQVYRVNMRSVFLTMKHALRRMIEQGEGGAIVNFSSLAALRARPDRSFYAASKRAVIALTCAAALENESHGIRVNTVAPGPIDSPMLRALNGTSRGAPGQAGNVRPGTPEEVASLVVFLLSEASGYCTGGVYTVDGGLHM